MAKLLQTLGSLSHRTHMVRLRLGVEFIRIADNLLFERLRLKARQSRSCMAFCHAGMSWVPFLTEQVATYGTMLDVGLRPVTMDRGRITLVYANIMQHGCLFQELHVNRQFLMLLRYLQTTVSHLTAVF